MAAVLIACGPDLPTGGGGGFDLSCSIPTDRIYSGGVPRDGIPSLTNPHSESAGQTALSDQSRVLGVVINGVPRAYPMLVMWWHEVVNDTVGGAPVVVSYCPLTGSGIAFDPNVGGQVRNFGVSGLLFENNLIMYDRESESLWNQMLVGAQCGPERGSELARIPVVETTWGAWSAMYPTSRVISTRTGFERPYGLYPYDDYEEIGNHRRNFPGSRFSNDRLPKELVLGLFSGNNAVAYPFGVFQDVGADVVVYNDTAVSREVLIAFDAPSNTALAFDRVVGGQTLTFSAGPGTQTFTDAETGSTWNFKGEAVAGSLAGSRLQLIADAYVAFWFAWSVYFPDLRLVEALN